MTQKAVARISLGKVGFGIIVVVLSFLASFLFSKLADFNDTLDEFSLSVRNFDRDGANKGLEALKKSYVSFSDLKLQYFADRFWFKDMYLYEAAVAIVNEDFEKVIEPNWIRGHEDDYRAHSMIGVAKFRVLHAAYHSEAAGKDKKLKDDIHKKVLDEVSPDFKAAVEKGPGPAKDFNSAYNYDLTSDPKSARKALESVRPGLRFILGIKVEGQGPKRPGRVKPGEKRVDDPYPGSGDTRKKG